MYNILTIKKKFRLSEFVHISLIVMGRFQTKATLRKHLFNLNFLIFWGVCYMFFVKNCYQVHATFFVKYKSEKNTVRKHFSDLLLLLL